MKLLDQLVYIIYRSHLDVTSIVDKIHLLLSAAAYHFLPLFTKHPRRRIFGTTLNGVLGSSASDFGGCHHACGGMGCPAEGTVRKPASNEEKGEDDTMTLPPERGGSRYAAVRRYSLAQILAVWAAAAIPMGLAGRRLLVADRPRSLALPAPFSCS